MRKYQELLEEIKILEKRIKKDILFGLIGTASAIASIYSIPIHWSLFVGFGVMTIFCVYKTDIQNSLPSKIKDLKKQLMNSEEEFNQFHYVNDLLNKCITNGKYFIEQPFLDKSKYLFFLEDFTIVYQKTDSVKSFHKILSNGEEDKEFKFTEALCQKIIETSLLLRKEDDISDHSNFIGNVQNVLRNQQDYLVPKEKVKYQKGSN